ncbi:hypothetical protein Cni_G12567 [Canna indica]|uniref:Uncharacterized protein n=1 Tax=Canna indica TaxID=4628 RepID=A0AAQ3K824_9LILI|nr:hypothetical protein Cni_G12567 [Canna indica]
MGRVEEKPCLCLCSSKKQIYSIARGEFIITAIGLPIASSSPFLLDKKLNFPSTSESRYFKILDTFHQTPRLQFNPNNASYLLAVDFTQNGKQFIQKSQLSPSISCKIRPFSKI